MVELAPAVIGDINRIDAVLDGDYRILRRGYSFENKWQAGYLPDRIHDLPGKCRPMLVPRTPPARGEPTIHHLSLAVAVVSGIHGEAQGLVA